MSDIQEVVDVGPELDFRLPELGVPVAALGKRETGEISQVMLNSRAGFIDYPPAYLAKSTVFASYCAHGLAPLLPGTGEAASDGIFSGRHFLIADGQDSGMSGALFQQIADNARTLRYGAHCTAAQARVFLKKLVPQ